MSKVLYIVEFTINDGKLEEFKEKIHIAITYNSINFWSF